MKTLNIDKNSRLYHMISTYGAGRTNPYSVRNIDNSCTLLRYIVSALIELVFISVGVAVVIALCARPFFMYWMYGPESTVFNDWFVAILFLSTFVVISLLVFEIKTKTFGNMCRKISAYLSPEEAKKENPSVLGALFDSVYNKVCIPVKIGEDDEK